MRIVAAILLLVACASAQPLSGTAPLTISGDAAKQMVDGISAYLLRETDGARTHRQPTRERLREIIGAIDRRVEDATPQFIATIGQPARLAETAAYTVYAVRWPVLDSVNAVGLLYEPKQAPVARVVAVPDADQPPENADFAQRLAENRCQVLVPMLIDRSDTFSGNPKFRMTNQPHREYIYRMAFPLGRHIIGYEVEKVQAAVDWFAKQDSKIPIGVWGYGEGGLIALYSAALDDRISTTVVSGYFQPRDQLWKEPIFRNVWSLLRNFGDAEIAGLVAPRALIVETRPGPVWHGPSLADPKRNGAAPGLLEPAAPESIEREVARARSLGARIETAADATAPFLKALGARSDAAHSPVTLRAAAPDARLHRQFQELIDYTQNLVRESEYVRNAWWDKADRSSPESWRVSTQPYRDAIWNDMIGRLPAPSLPLNPRTRKSYGGDKWDGYEVTLDLWPDVFAYGVLLLPRDLRPGERRPVVVVQHGLEGRAQFMFGQPEIARDANGRTSPFGYYRNIGARLANMGFIVYSPQNPYIGEFRHLHRQANPLQLSIFSFILAQNERLLEWLGSLAFVDHSRIGFYGLSYGGKTALRIPTLLDSYALSICSGDFNEWIRKLTAVDIGLSYMFTGEYEMDEWNMGHVANHAELAMLMAPRPFMVERGHRDGVGVDEWIAYEYAKVQRLYDEMGLQDRARIEYFNGPHMIHGVGTVDFLKKFLRWP